MTTPFQKGQTIGRDLSEALRDLLTKDDLADVANEEGVSTSLIVKLTYRQTEVSQRSIRVIEALINRADAKASQRLLQTKEYKRVLLHSIDSY